MSDAYQAGIVCILATNGTPAGTGFVVSDDGLIATCAHVIGESIPEGVDIVFLTTGEQRTATLLSECWRSENAEDLAFLRVQGGLPRGVTPLPLGSARGTAGHKISTFGFPSLGLLDGAFGRGTVLGFGEKIKRGNPLLQLRSSEITPGFSGAPIWDTIGQCVIGMVVEIARPDEYGRMSETAFATPTEVLRQVCTLLQLSDIRPYRSLDIFTEADANFFFGRKRVVALLLKSLHDNPRFLAVFGPSGSGKSSVVQAGLIPSLRQGVLASSDRWEILITHPTDPTFRQKLDKLDQEVAERRVIVIDQFEELFVNFTATDYRPILTQLSTLLDGSASLTIILTMRDDFFSSFARFGPFAERLRHSLVTIPAILTNEEILDIIEKPIQRVGLRFETGLAQAIAKDALETVSHTMEEKNVASSTILPLLEFTLAQLWERRTDGILPYAAYKGVTGSLADWANQQFDHLDLQQRQIARRIFTALIHLGNESQGLPDTRQRSSLSSLVRKDDDEIVRAVIRKLVDARLLVTSQDEHTHEETVQLIHESLLSEWGQLKEWIKDDRVFLAWHQKFEEHFQKWIATNIHEQPQRDKDALLRGKDLTGAEDWLKDRTGELSNDEQDFIYLSREERTREDDNLKTLLEESERQRMEAKRQQQLAEMRWQEAQEQRQIALARGLAAQAELLRTQYIHLLEQSVLLAVESLRRFPSPEADQTLRDGGAFLRRRLTTLTFQGWANEVVFSSDGRLLATASSDQTAGIWEVASGRRLMTLTHQNEVNTVAFSSDGRLLVTISNFGQPFLGPERPGSVQIWEMASGRQLAALPHQGNISEVAFSLDRRLLATVSNIEQPFLSSERSLGSTQVWDVDSGRCLVTLPHQGRVNAVALSSDGRLLVTASNLKQSSEQSFEQIIAGSEGSPSSVQIWEVASGRQLIRLMNNQNVRAVKFSPDGRLLAILSYMGYNSESVQVWEIASGRHLATLTHQDIVQGVAFSPDNQLLATASDDQTAGIWEVSSARRLATLTHQRPVRDVVFSPDGLLLATRSTDQTAGVWEVSSARRLATLTHQDIIQGVAFSPDGRLLVTRSTDQTVGVWEIANDRHLPALTHEESVRAMTFSPDGRWFATASGKTAGVWEVASGRQLVRLMHNQYVSAVAFSPDGRLLATASGIQTAGVWEVSSARYLTTLTHQGAANYTNDYKLLVVFSPDGQLLATASGDQTAGIWEVSTGRRLATLTHQGAVKGVAFSPNGQLLATASDDQTAGIWEVSSARRLATLTHQRPVREVAFSPDGQLLATASGDQTAGIWEVSSARRLATLTHQGAVSSVAFSPDGRLLATASGDQTVGIFSPSRGLLPTASGDQTAELWEVTTGHRLATLTHQDIVKSVAFSPDSQLLATTSGDQTARIWEVTTGRLLVRLVHKIRTEITPSTLVFTAFSPDGQYLATAGGEEVRLWLYRPEDLIADVQARLSRNLTLKEWQQYLGTEPYRKTFQHLP